MTTPLNPEELQVGTSNGPGIYVAPPGTLPPQDTFSDWPDPWTSLGYLSDDGPTIATSVDTEDLTPWQARSPVRTVITARAMTLQFVLWQINPVTLALYFDTDEPASGAGGAVHMEVRSDSPQHMHAIGIDARDGDRVFRLAFRRASLSDAGDISISSGATVPLDVTLSALDDAGVLAELMTGPAAAPGAEPASATRAARTPATAGTVTRAGAGGE